MFEPREESLEGVFLKHNVIVNVTDVSGTSPFPGDAPCEGGMEITYSEVSGKGFQSKMTLLFEFQRDEIRGVVTDFDRKKSWRFEVFLEALGFTRPYDDVFDKSDPNHPKLKKDFFARLVGKHFHSLVYASGLKPNGKVRWKHWPFVLDAALNPNELLQRFKKAVANGKIKDWTPNITPKPVGDVMSSGNSPGPRL